MLVLVVDLPSDRLASESKLPGETASPDDDGDDGNDGEAQPTTSLAREPTRIENKEADEESADYGTSTFQGGDDSTCGSIEFGSVDSSLIGVEVVGSEEHGEKRYMPRAGKLGLSERRI